MAQAKGTAVVKAKLNLPVDFTEMLAKEVAEIAKRVGAPGGDRIQITQSKTFRLPDGQEKPGPLDLIIVDFVAAYYFYREAYQRGVVLPPACFAIGLEPSGLVPSEKSPEVQAGSCASCWANQFGSDLNGGKGKACQNTRLLACLTANGPDDEPFSILKVSATGLKNFDGYVSTIAQSFNAPVRAVITQVSFADTEYASLRFGNPQPCTKEQFMKAHSRKEAALQRLMTEPEFNTAANDAKFDKKAAPSRRAPPVQAQRAVAGKRR